MDYINSILDNIDEALIITDEQGKIVLFNKSVFELGNAFLIAPPCEGQYLIESIDLGRQSEVEASLRGALLNKKTVQTFGEFTSQEGVTIYLEHQYVPICNDEGNVGHIYLFIRDITPQKTLEKRLVDQIAHMHKLIETANAIIIGIDTQGYVIDWNNLTEELTGFAKEEVFTRKFSEVLLDENHRSFFDDLMVRILAKEPVANCEITLQTKGGKQIITLVSGTPVITPLGGVIGVTLVGQDITELIEYRKSLEMKVEERTRELQTILKKEKEVVELKGRFVSMASHEFRTPLSSILHSANFIKTNGHRITKDEMTDKLEAIEKQIKHMTYLLDDVLTYGKSEAGKIQLVVSRIALVNFINKIVEDVGHVTKNSHKVNIEFNGAIDEIETDEKLLQSVLINLLTNAIKFSPDKKEVFLTINGRADQLIVKVRDEGLGIPREDMDKIFEPFMRGKSVSAISGTGLGLSIIKKAVELMEGTIAVESEVNRQTMFTVTIPVGNKQ